MIAAEPAIPSKILLIEVNATSRAALASALESAGFAVHTAADGSAALAQLTRAATDLIILDLGANGAALAAELRAVQGSKRTPIVALGGFTESSDIGSTENADFDALLFRPVDPTALVRAVRTHLGGATRPVGERPILIIDDDPIQAKLLALHLCQMDFAVLVAHDGEAGLEQARTFQPAAILSDVLMPGIDGFQLCVQARADAMLAQTPIVLVTNNPVHEADQRAAQRLGASALVQSDAEFRGATRALLAALTPSVNGDSTSARLLPDEQSANGEVRTSLNSDLARRCAMQTAQLAVLSRIDEPFLEDGLSRVSLHRELLGRLIETTGAYCGAILARDDDRRLSVSAHAGLSDATAKLLPGLLAAEGPLNEAMKQADALHLSSPWSRGGAARSLMSALGAETAWISPLRFGHDDLGLVLLAAPTHLGGGRWTDVAQSTVHEIARVTALSQQMNRLRSLASFDAMTGLPNRAYFEWHLRKFGRDQARGALYLLKLERFQELRSLLGVKNSQALVRQLAARLRTGLPSHTLLARMEYDEFAVLRDDTADTDSMERAAQRLLESLAPAFKLAGLPITVRTRMGIAELNSGDAEAIVGRADAARRQARQAGRDYAIYRETSEAEAADHLTLLNALRHAIEYNELALHYQPKVRLDSGETVGVEALLRWYHPGRGWIAPDRFIPLAEQAGLIYPITLWVAGSALAQANVWRAAGRRVEVAVNLSGGDLRDPTFPDILAKVCQSKGAANDELTLEFSERSLSVDRPRAAAALARLHDMGFHLSLDDFGAGHCSLADLQALPIKELKIDRSFISGLSENPRSSAMVRSIIDLGRNLDVDVVAKGIESRESWDVLDNLGCDLGQGFFICRPSPPSELAARQLTWLERGDQASFDTSPLRH